MAHSRDGNPFTPTFGVTPPLLVGRDDELADIEAALDASIGDPYRAVMVTGLRGAGKTVFLNQVEDYAHTRGWAVLSETARPGLVDRLTDTVIPALLADADPEATATTTTGGSIGVLGNSASVDREVRHRYESRPDLRSLLTRLADLKDARDVGVLITLDEVNRTAAGDLQLLTQVVQHCFREGRNVAFVAAGLPLETQSLLDGPGTTFLRRAERIVLGAVSEAAVRRGLIEPLATWGRTITPAAADIAVAGAKGYPFLIQAIGHRLWSRSTEHTTIEAPAAEAAVAYATRRVGDLVMTPEMKGLSGIDRSYLTAMALDPGPSRTRDIADRLGVSPQYAGVYRARLLEAGLIVDAGHGLVDLALPTFRDYLRQHAATEPLTPTPTDPSGTAKLQASQQAHERHTRAQAPRRAAPGRADR